MSLAFEILLEYQKWLRGAYYFNINIIGRYFETRDPADSGNLYN